MTASRRRWTTLPGFDDRLTRELERVARPADPFGVLERVQVRRTRRESRRRLTAGILALAVIATTTGGFVVLSRAFRDRTDGTAVQIPTNGLIVFSKDSAEGTHLFLIKPDGSDLRQLTRGNVGDYYPAWSPDGRRIVFMRQDLLTSRLLVMSVESGETTRITPLDLNVSRPAWSPDGELIAFAAVEEDRQIDEQQDVISGIWVVRPDGSGLRRLTDQPLTGSVGPVWSPDGSAIAFTSAIGQNARAQDLDDVYLIGRDGSGFRNLTETPDPERNEIAIGWLANGNVLIAESPGGVAGEPGIAMEMSRWYEIRIDGAIERIVFEASANAPDRLDQPSVSPDGRFVLFNGDGGQVWFMDLATSTFTKVTDGPGSGAAWQPIPAGASTESQPSPSPSPATIAGRDIGLPVRVCAINAWDGDFDGDGRSDRAYLATQVNSGRCPTFDVIQHAGIDLDRDGHVDASIGPLPCEPRCMLFAAPDLNRDGRGELLLSEGHLASPVSAWIGVYGLDGSRIRPISFPDGSNRFKLEVVASVPSFAGAFCSREGEERTFSLWEAAPPTDDPRVHDVTERTFVMDVRRFTFTLADTRSSTQTSDALPPTGIDGRICGALTQHIG